MTSFRQTRRAYTVLMLLVAVGLWLTGAAQAKTIYVPANYKTIQAAITAAVKGDVVVVAKGTYKENIVFKDKAITVRSSDPTNVAVVAATIIDGQKKRAVVSFKLSETANSVLRGFTITNGVGTEYYSMDEGTTYRGGGVDCRWASPTIADNIIRGNGDSSEMFSWSLGGGVYCLGGSPTLTNNTIRENCANYGGGVYCDGGSPILTNNTITGNKASCWGGGYGGGVYCFESAPTLTNNTIAANSAIGGTDGDGVGGGVYCYGASPTIKNTIIAFSGSGGGLYVAKDEYSASKPVITYSDVYGNTGGNYVNWPNQTGKNGNIGKNPLFAWVARDNFYEQSKGGRWNPVTKSWIIDKAQSPCINAGDPKSAFANEPAPNGGRINMGAYGNTKYASKSAPKSASGGLLVSAAAAPVSGGGAQFSVNLSAAASVAVTITNVAGRPVATLPASDLPEGMSTLLWSGKGRTGLRVPSGTYLARVTARTEEGSQAQALSSLALSR